MLHDTESLIAIVEKKTKFPRQSLLTISAFLKLFQHSLKKVCSELQIPERNGLNAVVVPNRKVLPLIVDSFPSCKLLRFS
jgi:hypothetical protein